MGTDHNKYDFTVKASELPRFMQKLIIHWGKDIVQIKINGEYYEIIDDLKR